jgi:hypothetical protein
MIIILIIYNKPLRSTSTLIYHIGRQVRYSGRYEIARRHHVIANIHVVPVRPQYQDIACRHHVITRIHIVPVRPQYQDIARRHHVITHIHVI